MIKYDERLTRISQAEFLQTIRDNANTMAILTGINSTLGLDSVDWVNMLFDKVDLFKTSIGPWVIEDGRFIFEKATGGGYRIKIDEDLKGVRRYYFKNEEHHILIRVARNIDPESAYQNDTAVRVAVLKYLFEE